MEHNFGIIKKREKEEVFSAFNKILMLAMNFAFARMCSHNLIGMEYSARIRETATFLSPPMHTRDATRRRFCFSNGVFPRVSENLQG